MTTTPDHGVIDAIRTTRAIRRFTDEPVTDFAAAQRQNTAVYAAFFHAALEQGVYLPPSAYEAWFLSAAHDDAALDRVVSAMPAAARAAAAAL